MVDKDVTISQLVLQNDLLRSQVVALERANAQLQSEMGQLRADNQHLQDQIARLKRDSSNSSKPPSSDIVKPKNQGTRRGRRKRKIGGQEGHPRHERIPFTPDDIGPILPYELSPKQAQGLIPLEEWFVLQQVDLAQKLYLVTEHRARKYLEPRTGRIVITPLPVAVKAAGLVGPKLSALAAYQKGDCHMSYTTIQRFWNDVLGIPISRSQLVNVIQKASAAFAEPYAELRAALVREPYVGADESGHNDWGDQLWTWCFRAARFTVFHIDPSRSSDVLKAILTKTFGGVVGSDYFSAYHKYMVDCEVLVQFCWAHLIRIRPVNHTLRWRADPRRSVLRRQFPPQPWIVLSFKNPPDVLCAVGRLAHEVPAGVQKRRSRLHLDRGLADNSIRIKFPNAFPNPIQRA